MEGVCSAFLENWHLTEEMMREKRSKIIIEAWHFLASRRGKFDDSD